MKKTANSKQPAFEEILKQRADDTDLSIIQVEVEFQSNIRVGVEHKKEPQLILGASKDYSDYESHILTFERYVKMP